MGAPRRSRRTKRSARSYSRRTPGAARVAALGARRAARQTHHAGTIGDLVGLKNTKVGSDRPKPVLLLPASFVILFVVLFALVWVNTSETPSVWHCGRSGAGFCGPRYTISPRVPRPRLLTSVRLPPSRESSAPGLGCRSGCGRTRSGRSSSTCHEPIFRVVQSCLWALLTSAEREWPKVREREVAGRRGGAPRQTKKCRIAVLPCCRRAV